MHKSLITPKGFNYLAFGVFIFIIGLFTDLVFSFACGYGIFISVVFIMEYRGLYKVKELDISVLPGKNEIVDQSFKFCLQVDIYNKSYREVEIHLSRLKMPIEVEQIELVSVDRINSKHYQCKYEATISFNRIGSYDLKSLSLKTNSTYGLWAREYTLDGLSHVFHIWPRREKISDEELRKIFHDQAFMGDRTGMSQFNTSRDLFFGMRDFQYGDSLRVIDPKKSARFGRPISKMYEESKSNNIFIFLDLGRNMEGRIEGSYLLNYYFYIMLSISQTALELGDKITLCGISDKVEFIYPSFNTMQSLKEIMANATKLKTKHVETNYHLVNQILEKYHVKRSLVILLSDFTKPSQQRSVKEVMSYISLKHIPLLFSLLDNQFDIDSNLDQEIEETEDYKRLIYSMAVKEGTEFFSKDLSSKGGYHFCVTSNKWMDFAPKAFKLVRETFIG